MGGQTGLEESGQPRAAASAATLRSAAGAARRSGIRLHGFEAVVPDAS